MDTLLFGVKISIIGFSIVFIALVIVAFVISLLEKFDLWINRAKKITKSDQTAMEETPADGVTPELIAVITAAITAATYKKFVVKRIRYRSGQPELSWSKDGRATIMATRSAAERR